MKKRVAQLLIVSSSLLMAEDTFTLGEISIIDQQENILDIKEISNNQLNTNPEKNVAKVLDTQAGISIEHKGGRADSSLMIRGLEASRTGIYLDGIPVYIPYDGQFDYSRVLSTNLSSINISKGFSSALFGPNAMSGTINFITQKPTKEFEGSISSQINMDSSYSKSQTINTLSLGSKKENYYFQFNGTLQNRDHWSLSEDYSSTSLQDEGERTRSDSDSKSFNLKAGYTPDDSLEHVIGFNYLNSEKSQPTVTDKDDGKVKYGDWPVWDSNSIYLISNKKFNTSDLKFKLYRTAYKNTYEDFKKDSTLTTVDSRELTNASSVGAGLEYSEYGWSDEHIVKFGFNYKKDSHQITREIKYSGENDDFKENIYSFAIEDIYEPNEKLKIISSVSYDYADPTKGITYDTNISDQLKSNDALNAQIGLFYDFLPNQTSRLTVARKTHLPTLKERFSDKRGKALINPDLDPEKATHFELGHNIKLNNLALDSSIFYINVKDPIRIVEDVSGSLDQEQNTGRENFKGFELALKYERDSFSTGFNYTYTKIDKKDSSIVVTDIPKHQAYIYASYSPVNYLTFSGNIAYKKDLVLEDANNSFVTVPSITVANINADYKYSKALMFSFGVENLTDENYELDLGYPEPGKEYYAKLTYKF